MDQISNLYKNGLSIKSTALKLRLPIHKVYKYLKENNVYIRNHSQAAKKYTFSLSFFKKLTTPLSYFLGWCAADGSVYSERLTFALQKRDTDVLYLFKSLLKSSHPIHIFKNRPTMAVLVVGNAEMVSILAQYNIVPRKTFIVTIPDIILNNDKYFWPYLRGLFEGDGCVLIERKWWYAKKKKINKFSLVIRASIAGNEKMISQISNVLSQKGILNSVYKDKSANRNHRDLYIKGGKKGTIEFLDKLYENHNGLYLNRKYNKYLEAKELIDV